MRLRHFAAATAMLVFSLAAHADTFAGSAFSGSGTLTGNLVNTGTYQITAVTGTTDTGNGTNRPIAGILAPGVYDGNDNLLLFTNGMYSFDLAGLSYSLMNGADVNMYELDREFLLRTSGAAVAQVAPITVTAASIAATPEPASLALLGTGMLGVVGAARRRLVK